VIPTATERAAGSAQPSLPPPVGQGVSVLRKHAMSYTFCTVLDLDQQWHVAIDQTDDHPGVDPDRPLRTFDPVGVAAQLVEEILPGAIG